MSSVLERRLLVVPSGYYHPYFAVDRNSSSRPEMLANITSYPALGRATVVPLEQQDTTFVVLLNTNNPNTRWHVQLWHSFHDHDGWEPLDFTELSQSVPVFGFHETATDGGSHPRCFTTTLRGRPPHNGPVGFTIRFRASDSDPWKWARDACGNDDGKLLYQPGLLSSSCCNFEDCIKGSDPALTISRPPGTTTSRSKDLWLIQAPVEPAANGPSQWARYRIGQPQRCVRWFSLVRLLAPWLGPRHGKPPAYADADSVLYSFLRDDGLHLVLLAVSGIGDIETVIQQHEDSLWLSARSDSTQRGTATVIACIDTSFDTASATAVYKARDMLSTSVMPASPVHLQQPATDDFHMSWFQEWFDGFTYCTWNGLGKNLTEEKIIDAIQSLHDQGVQVTNLIIDDGWQSVDKNNESNMKQGWMHFEADEKAFPNGLEVAVRSIRRKFSSLRHVAVWHALLGYWGGIAPSGRIAREYNTRKVAVNRDAIITDGEMLVVDEPDVSRLYNDFYSFLASCTVDSVKTDAQFALDEFSNASDRRDLTNLYPTTWSIAHLRHFSDRAVSCMSQTPNLLFQSQLPQTSPRLPVRNSDDFFPHVEASHPWHVFCNAHNALFTKYLNALPDWDMFQTAHPWGAFHAAARCLSGGPIYITDEPGRHDVKLLREMTARTIQDQTVIIRPSVVGRSGNVYVGYEENALCRIAAYHGHAETGASFLGLFNCRSWTLMEMFDLGDFMGTEQGKYLIRSFRTGLVSTASRSAPKDLAMAIRVRGHDWDILTATPITTQRGSDHGKTVTVAVSDLGLISHMSGAAALLSTTVSSLPQPSEPLPAGYTQYTGRQNAQNFPVSDNRTDRPNNSFGESSVPHSSLKLSSKLKALGTWGVWLELDKGVLNLGVDMLVTFGDQVIPEQCVELRQLGGTVVDVADADKPQAYIAIIELDKAWDLLRPESDANNEVNVELYVRLHHSL